eukprot:c2355_g1_i1.p1 GENE.c2355_g1_i1~~c2355_g1_i1.p1  ORF type:complete len:179 (+),score=44.73 c2355_g1_i1:28-537(+)
MATPELTQQWFLAVDTDRSGQIDANELQRALNNQEPFSLSTVKLIIKMFDKSGNGTINYDEFCGLWRYLVDWRTAFNQYDRDKSGTMDPQELIAELRTQGFNFTPDVYDAVIKSFAPNGLIKFDQFIEINVMLGWIRNAFMKMDVQHKAVVTLDYATFIKVILQFHMPQ